MASNARDAVLLACVEALCRWKRPSTGAWALIGNAATRLGLGCPTSPDVIDCVTRDGLGVVELEPMLRVVTEARLGSRLGAEVSCLKVAQDTVQVSVASSSAVVAVRLHVLASEDDLSQRSRWPLARLQAASWPGWQCTALVAQPSMLLADALQRWAADATGAGDEVRWLCAHGVVDPDMAVIAGRAGRADASSPESLWASARARRDELPVELHAWIERCGSAQRMSHG